MRRRARVDNNQKEIVAGLRAAGYAVLHLHAVGGGCPDLLVSSRRHMRLMEVKEAKGVLTPCQVEFFEEWKGVRPAIVRSVEDAIGAMTALDERDLRLGVDSV